MRALDIPPTWPSRLTLMLLLLIGWTGIEGIIWLRVVVQVVRHGTSLGSHHPR